jgi:hypothetical protein
VSGATFASRGLQVVCGRIGLASNNPELLGQPAYLDAELQEAQPRIWSLLSSLPSVEEVPYGPDLDGYLTVVDGPEQTARILPEPNGLTVFGPISDWEQDPPDRRYTLYGNAGLLSKLVYSTLERRQDVLSFHAVVMTDQGSNAVYVVIGSAGAGKTVMMLEGCLRRGFRVFATEMAHLQVRADGVRLHKGSLYDNIRLATLLEDFPEGVEALGLKAGSAERPGDVKLAASFRRIEEPRDVIDNPRLHLIFPRIEGERRQAQTETIKDRHSLIRALYENASEMIVRPRLYYGRLPFASPDEPEHTRHRLRLVEGLVERADLGQAKTILAGTRNSMDGID